MFFLFWPQNVNFGLKIKILKFLGIQSSLIHRESDGFDNGDAIEMTILLKPATFEQIVLSRQEAIDSQVLLAVTVA